MVSSSNYQFYATFFLNDFFECFKHNWKTFVGSHVTEKKHDFFTGIYLWIRIHRAPMRYIENASVTITLL